jgi:tRNA(Ile)-lysidine synthase
MHKFVRSLITEWRKLELPVAAETVVLAVSGGADSMALLIAVHDLVVRKKLQLEIVVGHFNHKLRGDESDADQEFVRERSAGFGFEFARGSANITRKGNLEQAARDARYKFLSEVASRHDARLVLTAHTRNDQAETFLLNLIRGSGSDGLTAMRAVRPLGDGPSLVRPLLSWASRHDTESFCSESHATFRADRMNDDERFTRVRIRKTVIPVLAELNPRIIETLARTAELLHGSQTPESDSIPEQLVLRDLTSLPGNELNTVLRSWLRSRRGTTRSLEQKHIEAIKRLIGSGKSGRVVEIPGQGRVLKHRGLLTFSNIKVEK